MKTENVVLNNSGEGEVVKETGEVLPDMSITILAKALIVESINLCDLLTFMVATQDGDTVGIANLHANKECDSFY